jgi:hypothetical protein
LETRVIKLQSVPRGTISVAFTAIAMAVFFLVLWTFPTVKPGSQSHLVSEMLRLYTWVGSYDQRMAHLLAMIAGFFLCGLAFVMARRGNIEPKGGNFLPTAGFWTCLAATIAVLLLFGRLTSSKIVADAWILSVGFFFFVVAAPFLSRRIVDNTALVLVGAYLCLILATGLLTSPIPFIAPDADVLAQIELHLNSLTLPGPGLSAGQSLFKELPFNYGLLMPSIMSVIDRRFGPMDVGDQARFVQYCQVLFALAATAAYLCYRPRNYLGIVIVLLLAAPYWTTAGPAVWHPNQSGLRSLTFPLGILALVLYDRFREKEADWWLGAAGAIALLINLETAIAVGFGYLIYLGLRRREFPIFPVIRMAAAVLAVFALYLLTYRWALGRLPFGGDFADILRTLLRHTSGSFGDRLFSAGPQLENYYLVPFALVMFAHAIYVIIDAFRKAGQGPLPHRLALRAAIAAILVVWLSYYFNFPNWWQIWTHLFLYGFLLIDLLDPRLAGLGHVWHIGARWLRPMRTGIGRIIPLLLLAFMIPHGNHLLMMHMRGFMYPYWVEADHSASVISGILMPRPIADELKAKTTKLLELYTATSGKLIYLTYNVTFIPTMSRIFEPVPERNIFSNIPGDSVFDTVMNGILDKKPEIILIDAPTGPLAVPGARKDFQERVRQAVAQRYQLAETEAGWQIWRPGKAP